jgi:hypothetical protein
VKCAVELLESVWCALEKTAAELTPEESSFPDSGPP